MLYPILFFCALVPLASSGQQNFSNLIWSEEFDGAGANWRQSNSADELFLVQDGKYITWRKNKTSPTLVLPQKGDLFSESRTELFLTIEEQYESGSAGLVCMADSKENSAVIFEINGKGEFRIRQLKNNAFSFLSGKEKNSGWERNKAVKKAGASNILGAIRVGHKVEYQANGTKVFEQELHHAPNGRAGIFIGSDSKAGFDYLRVYVSEEEAERINKERESGDPVKAALTDIIAQLRTTINKQNKELDSLDSQLKKIQAEEDKQANNPKNIKKLTTQVNELKKENATLSAKVAQLEKENKKLKEFKTQIQKGQNGDIVVNLSNLLASEKEQKEALQKENEELKRKIAELEKKLKEE